MRALKPLLLVVLLFLSQVLLSQTTERPTEWTVYTEVNGVIFYYKYADCHDYNQGFHRQYVLFKLVNTTSTDLTCTWDEETWYAGVCSTCPEEGENRNPELHISINLLAGETQEATCNYFVMTPLKIFSKHLNYDVPKSELSAFDLVNIDVYPSN